MKKILLLILLTGLHMKSTAQAPAEYSQKGRLCLLENKYDEAYQLLRKSYKKIN